MVYLTCAAAAGALLVASVVKALLFAPPAAASGASVAECRAEIQLQLRRLDVRVAETLATPFDPDASSEARRSAAEREDWEQIEAQRARLRGSCLAAAGHGTAAKAMTEALDALGQVERGYRQLLESYHRDVAADRHRLRQSLAELRRDVSSAAGDPP